MPYQPLMMQSWSFAYAILYDTSEKPIFPKALAVVNIAAPIIYIPALAVHCFFTGPLAWNGAYNFWVAGIVYVVQLLVDCFSLWQAASTDSDKCSLKSGASESMADLA
ncbi:hypothetical protein NLG97_g9096 [Lecanicillium saksenae]|uniref:Uncharacterized protein n=1 Tax=Lecanicillium saksenae TaxID=468837 RepID=A0ACC1QKW6_9HYPO|nr:hypothetical protein NLG97_g9096 [Lecanicillium saksenae]